MPCPRTSQLMTAWWGQAACEGVPCHKQHERFPLFFHVGCTRAEVVHVSALGRVFGDQEQLFTSSKPAVSPEKKLAYM